MNLLQGEEPKALFRRHSVDKPGKGTCHHECDAEIEQNRQSIHPRPFCEICWQQGKERQRIQAYRPSALHVGLCAALSTNYRKREEIDAKIVLTMHPGHKNTSRSYLKISSARTVLNAAARPSRFMTARPTPSGGTTSEKITSIVSSSRPRRVANSR